MSAATATCYVPAIIPPQNPGGEALVVFPPNCSNTLIIICATMFIVLAGVILGLVAGCAPQKNTTKTSRTPVYELSEDDGEQLIA